MVLSWPYENVDDRLFIDGVSSMDIARRYGTPVYVYSENLIRKQFKKLNEKVRKYYPKTRLLYAAKANTNINILNILREEGAEIDAVSPGEVFLSLAAGYKPSQILFTGTSVSYNELIYLLDSKVRINVDSHSQLERILDIEVPELISIRINPEFGAGHHEHAITAGPNVKFGIWDQDSVDVYNRALKAGVKNFGIQMHIGSGIFDVGSYLKASTRLLEIAKKIHDKTGISFDFIDLGGGIGVPYKLEDDQINLDDFMERLFGHIKNKLNEYNLGSPEIWFEPGRFFVAEAGIILTRVTTVKMTPYKTWVGVDAGFNTLIRPALYGSYHEIITASKLGGKLKKYDVYGPLCESGDVFAHDRDIPEVSEGSLLAIMNSGAYGYSMSSQYNSRPRASEVVVKDGKDYLIRERENFEDLLKGQIMI
ncbi:diaminopimelate decarboxylase [Candidatus Bathyarchaeota archaeon]|nr:diaminopimelate decarboxylase [Candidatus Bathyarchaeota archaeon]